MAKFRKKPVELTDYSKMSKHELAEDARRLLKADGFEFEDEPAPWEDLKADPKAFLDPSEVKRSDEIDFMLASDPVTFEQVLKNHRPFHRGIKVDLHYREMIVRGKLYRQVLEVMDCEPSEQRPVTCLSSHFFDDEGRELKPFIKDSYI